MSDPALGVGKHGVVVTHHLALAEGVDENAANKSAHEDATRGWRPRNSIGAH